jgi:hypothetical protein
MLSYLSAVAKGPVQKVELLINIITVTFDMNQPTQASSAVPLASTWRLCAWGVVGLLHLARTSRAAALYWLQPSPPRAWCLPAFLFSCPDRQAWFCRPCPRPCLPAERDDGAQLEPLRPDDV